MSTTGPRSPRGRLVDQDPRVGQRHPLAVRAGGEQQRAHRRGDPDARRRDVGRDELHRVVNRHPGVIEPPGQLMYIEMSFSGSCARGGKSARRSGWRADRRPPSEEDDPLFEQPGEDVVLPLATRGLLDDHGDERHVPGRLDHTVRGRGEAFRATGPAGARSGGPACAGPGAARRRPRSATCGPSASPAARDRRRRPCRLPRRGRSGRSAGAKRRRGRRRESHRRARGRGCRLVNQAVRARDAHEHAQRGPVVGRVEDHAWRMLERADAPAQAQPVAVEQMRIEQHDVRALALHQLHPVADGGADRHEAGLRPQHHGQPGPHGRPSGTCMTARSSGLWSRCR